MNKYENEWRFIDEASNGKDLPYMDFILEETYAQVHREIHPQVDVSMRLEYELLQRAKCKDLKKKYKKPKAKRAKGKKGKKGKKKRAAVDKTGDTSIESLIIEMIENGIIIDVPHKSFSDFAGDYNYLAYDKRNIEIT